MKSVLVFGILVFIMSPVFAQISSGLQPGECWELIPGHQACCGDSICSTDALETCSVCEQDCFCAPNFECSPLMTDENRQKIADDRGCIPAGFDTPPVDGGYDTEPAPDCCGAIVFILAPLFAAIVKK